MKKTTKKKPAAPPSTPTTRKAGRRIKSRRRQVAAMGPEAMTALAVSAGRVLGGLQMAPGARLAINIGPHGSHLDYIRPPAQQVTSDALAQSFIRGFNAATDAKPVAETPAQ